MISRYKYCDVIFVQSRSRIKITSHAQRDCRRRNDRKRRKDRGIVQRKSYQDERTVKMLKKEL